MRKVLAFGLVFGLFLLSFSAVVEAEEHTKEYKEWRKNTLDSIDLSSRCVQVKRNINKLAENLETHKLEDLKVIEGYIEWLHEKFIISNRDCDLSKLRVDNIPGAMVSDALILKLLAGEFVEAMKPLDELAYISDLSPKNRSRISSTKLESVKFLHFLVRNLQVGDPRKAMQEVNDFKNKY